MTASQFRFEDPWWALLLLALVPVVWLRGRRGVRALVIPFAAAWHRPSAASLSQWPVACLAGACLLGVGGLMRPQWVEEQREVRREGYDIMLAVDLSGSMLAEDYRDPQSGRAINRLQAVVPVIEAFIQKRTADRIGVVVFAGRAYTLAPLTFDHDWLLRQMQRLRVGMLEDGTAVGDGLGVALTRLERKGDTGGEPRKGAFVILLTDGASNRGAMEPLQAADIARARGIPVYSIGAGTDGFARVPVHDREGRVQGYRMMQGDLDEPTMREIASRTGGKFFRAMSSDTVMEAFRAIDKAQKIEFQATVHEDARELFAWPAGAAVLLSGAAAAGVARRREVVA